MGDRRKEAFRKEKILSGEARGPRAGCGPGMGRGGSLLELELPGLLVLRLLQVLPHTDVLIMLVLDLRLHRLQLGVELGGDRCSSEATRAQGPRLSTG